MPSLGPIAFAAPWLLLALAALPVIWWLLRVTPPAPRDSNNQCPGSRGKGLPCRNACGTKSAKLATAIPPVKA